MLRRAAHLHALGAVGIEGAIGVLLRLATTSAATSTTAAVAVATALPLHPLEISHDIDLFTARFAPLSPDAEALGATVARRIVAPERGPLKSDPGPLVASPTRRPGKPSGLYAKVVARRILKTAARCAEFHFRVLAFAVETLRH
jgi:hypothetical protein